MRTGLAVLALLLAVGVIAPAGVAQAAAASPHFSAQGKKQVAASEQEPRFKGKLRKVTLASPLLDPMELAVAADGRVFYIQRGGQVLGCTTRTTAKRMRSGALLSPPRVSMVCSASRSIRGSQANGWIYLAYSRAVGSGVEVRVSRFTVTGGALDTESERCCSRSRHRVAAATRPARWRSAPREISTSRPGTTRTRSSRRGTRRSTSARGARSGMPRGRRVTRWTCAARSFASRRATMAATRSRPAISSRAGGQA